MEDADVPLTLVKKSPTVLGRIYQCACCESALLYGTTAQFQDLHIVFKTGRKNVFSRKEKSTEIFNAILRNGTQDLGAVCSLQA